MKGQISKYFWNVETSPQKPRNDIFTSVEPGNFEKDESDVAAILQWSQVNTLQ
jgi:hypothetical protein